MDLYESILAKVNEMSWHLSRDINLEFQWVGHLLDKNGKSELQVEFKAGKPSWKFLWLFKIPASNGKIEVFYKNETRTEKISYDKSLNLILKIMEKKHVDTQKVKSEFDNILNGGRN